jgi:S1-C subfamily serine protease
VGLDSDLDLAIIQIPTKTLHHLPIAATGVELGADIFILNSASSTGGLTRAVINAVRLIEGTVLIQFDQPIPSSDCGSPLVTEQGTAIGIVSEKLRQDIDNTGFGVRLEKLDRLSAD